MIHTVGHPLDSGTYGGGWIYHMDNRCAASCCVLRVCVACVDVCVWLSAFSCGARCGVTLSFQCRQPRLPTPPAFCRRCCCAFICSSLCVANSHTLQACVARVCGGAGLHQPLHVAVPGVSKFQTAPARAGAHPGRHMLTVRRSHAE